ncbi:GNAT family N-acetyltransferase [Palleronia abyssalis]|mgnify:CR=1 FL=1|uniref:Acetyltransferase n=1 Tax=Palleronia abyssalis TaxID=1501240 RepID=A0A2R8BUG6_9RHOB|nr:GNAT family N-acetyltransferase [Palleronia abyssalis]SPJ23773.1 Acetyltransferase [Palleronia abyssalis]
MTVEIRESDTVSPDARDQVETVLTAHAEEAGHPFTNAPCILEAWDGDTFAGALHAEIGSHWVFVKLLGIAPDYRQAGLGSRLLRRIEDIARNKGKTGIWLDTYSFQAPDFYPRHGFTEIGRIEDYPPGQSRIFFQKRL